MERAGGGSEGSLQGVSMAQDGDLGVKAISSLDDLELDALNANLGTERGMWTL